MENRRSKILSKTPMVQKVIDVYKISYKELEDIYNEIQKVRKKLDDIYYHLKQDKGFLEMIKKIYDEFEKMMFLTEYSKLSYTFFLYLCFSSVFIIDRF